MSFIRINNKWVQKVGEEEDCEMAIIFDSQAKEACRRPNSFGIPPKAVVFAISGGGVRDALALRNEPAFRRAKFIVLAGIGANDLAAYAHIAEPAPPRVIEVKDKGAAGHELVRGAQPSAIHQRPRRSPSGHGTVRYEDILTAYEEIYAALRPDQILITMTPIGRKSSGFLNFQLGLLESRVSRIGFHHHHVNTLKAFVSTVKRRCKNPLFGGKQQSKDTKFSSDDVHLTADSVRLLFEGVRQAVKAIKPAEQAQQSGKIVCSSDMHFKFAF